MLWKTILIAFFAVGAFGSSIRRRQNTKEKYRQMCQNTGNLDKLDDVEKAVEGSIKCFEDTIDMDTLPREIRNAMINGGLKEVFKGQCAKSAQIKACWHTLRDGLALCMDAESRDFLTHNNATEEIIDFVCYHDGERIIKFVIDDGPECFQQKARAVSKCAENIQEDVSSPQALSELSSTEQCTLLDNLTSCVVNELKTCSTSAAADLMESLLQLVRRSTPCK